MKLSSLSRSFDEASVVLITATNGENNWKEDIHLITPTQQCRLTQLTYDDVWVAAAAILRDLTTPSPHPPNASENIVCDIWWSFCSGEMS